ncbi:uncharacterized protein F4807DRAFT_40274 [Annulohypoxylon truncatum]|uniref:uncharacterized protein n=1 Tax=Annulohypoxylon truncatum TaxID=327061 RepID=UPI002007610C|nr:uncharacterized protein F4807DRAFT_40274 [Annulohypoxylon truncatum]KAI1210823.1 hypothetical protein F4807DRAFT_40274 [Annulohypoxylon truncatum]
MCRGNQTKMACGHVLTHYTQRCKKGQQKPCPNPKSDAPRQHLNDSCVECDSDFKKNQLSREHKSRHEELVAQLIADKRVNESKEARRLLECMQKMSNTVNREIGEVKTTGFSADVEFPGGGNHRMSPKITSKWINGKCVWGEEEWNRSGSSRIKKIAPATSTTAAIVETPTENPISGPPRLRTTKKEYFNRLPEEEKEQPKISGPPRLRTNKPYSGPRENVVVFDEQVEKPHLRRTSKVANGLNLGQFSDQRSDVTVKYAGEEQNSRPSTSNSQSSGLRAVPTRSNVRVPLDDDGDSDEDMWLQLAEKRKPVNVIGKGPLRSFKDRISSA